MAMPSSKIVKAHNPPPLFSGNGYNLQTLNVAVVNASQAIQEPPQLKHTLRRRDAAVFLTASLMTTLLPIKAVEARTTKAENKRKVKEKLDKLREKAGVSKSKADSSSGGEEKKSDPKVANQLKAPDL